MTASDASTIYDGFFLPRAIDKQWLQDVEYAYQTFANGRPAQPGSPGSVTVRWPILTPDQYSFLTDVLYENNANAPKGDEFWLRFLAALQHAAGRLANPADALHHKAMAALPAFTGYSPQMIALSLQAMDWFSLERLQAAFLYPPDAAALYAWQPFTAMPGWLRFYQYPTAGTIWLKRVSRILRREPPRKLDLYRGWYIVRRVVGYGSGNVPGASLLIGLLAQAVALGIGLPPAALLRNSRREPIFTPLVLHAMEDVDPDVVSMLAALVWNYEDLAIQKTLMRWADTVIAAAGDETIGRIGDAIEAAARCDDPRVTLAPARFYPHGHKVSFALIGREIVETGEPLLEKAARLAALDSAFWDQNGCLSARVHFVEQGGGAGQGDSSQRYARVLVAALRGLAVTLPRGAWPRRELHDRFDRYQALQAAGQVQVFSSYDDDFVVFADLRPWDEAAFRQVVNDCQGRTIAVRPVPHRLDIPRQYLPHLPPANLQSLSVAAGAPGQALDAGFMEFAEACGKCGITAIRSVGRGAFPQLPYSWDGYLPYDLIRERPEGYFSTIEFDAPLDEMLATYEMFAHLWR